MDGTYSDNSENTCMNGVFVSYGNHKELSKDYYERILLIDSGTSINKELLSDYDIIVIDGGNVMSEAAIRARQHSITCIVGAHNAIELLNPLDRIRSDYSNNIIYVDDRSITVRPIQEATYLDIENIKPYDVRDVNNILQVGALQFLESPTNYVLLKFTKTKTIIYAHDVSIITKNIMSKIEQLFGKEPILGCTDVYENYTSIAYGIYTDDKFKQIFKDVSHGCLTINKIRKLSARFSKESVKRLDDAEEIIKHIEVTGSNDLREILIAFRAINDSAISFTFANEVLPTYGLHLLISRFKELRLDRLVGFIDFISAIDRDDCGVIYSKVGSDTREISELISMYSGLVNCKKIANMNNQYDRRSQHWSKAAKLFRIKTGHKPSEFLGQHGSGYKFESFLISPLDNSGNSWEKLRQVSKL